MKEKPIVTRTSRELAELLGLTDGDALDWELRSSLTKRIKESFKKGGYTVTEIAEKAGTSRARVTKILKHHSIGISLDVLVHVLAAVGDTVKMAFKKAK